METFLVGGAVRDQFMGLEAKDEDWVVVGSTPEEMVAHGFTQVGADFPVFLDMKGQEFALARTERKTGPGHHGFETDHSPDVTLEDDLLRRDFTMNAMAKLSDGSIFDPHNGRRDILDKTIRHVSDAFREDPLRVLRAARFAARFNFAIAPETMALMMEMVADGELDHLTKERVWKEVSRAMMEPKPELFFEVLADCNALHVVGLKCGPETVDEFAVDELISVARFHSKPMARWMALSMGMSTKNRNRFLDAIKAPNEVRDAMNFAPKMLTAWRRGNVDEVMILCKQFRLFQRIDLVIELMFMVLLLDNSGNMDEGLRFMDFHDAVARAAEFSRDDLDEEERETLKGKAIGEAIDRERMAILDSHLGA